MPAAVFLDRDNTLVHRADDCGDPQQIRMIRGAASAVASLRGLGYRVVVVTNLAGVAEGNYTEEDVRVVHHRINELIGQTTGAAIDQFYYCPYDPDATVEAYRCDHPWRKPAPGMLLQAADDMDLDLTQSWMIGENLSDIQAGAAAGVRTILLGAQGSATAEHGSPTNAVEPDFVAPNLVEAIKAVAKQRTRDVRRKVAPRTDAKGAPHVEVTAPNREPAAATTAKSDRADAVVAGGRGPARHREPTDQPADRPEDEIEYRLGQILRELRGQRIVGKPFTFLLGAAIGCQVVAIVCLLGALLTGMQEDPIFMRWIASALLVQLATIALLLFDRRP